VLSTVIDEVEFALCVHQTFETYNVACLTASATLQAKATLKV
jgi:hypothetical protein